MDPLTAPSVACSIQALLGPNAVSGCSSSQPGTPGTVFPQGVAASRSQVSVSDKQVTAPRSTPASSPVRG